MTERVVHPNPELDELLDRLYSGALKDGAFVATEALAVGGSLSRGLARMDSDLDLYCIVAGADLVAAGQAIVEWVGDVQLVHGPREVTHFGSSISFLLPELSMCQVNLNTRESFEMNAMRSRSVMVFDRTGWLTERVSAAAHAETDVVAVFDELVVWYWHRIVSGWRAARRGQLWRSLRYLANVQEMMIQTMRIIDGRFDAAGSPLRPATRAEDDLGVDRASEVGPATARYSRSELEAAYLFAAEWFLTIMQELSNTWPSCQRHLSSAEQIVATLTQQSEST